MAICVRRKRACGLAIKFGVVVSGCRVGCDYDDYVYDTITTTDGHTELAIPDAIVKWRDKFDNWRQLQSNFHNISVEFLTVVYFD